MKADELLIKFEFPFEKDLYNDSVLYMFVF